MWLDTQSKDVMKAVVGAFDRYKYAKKNIAEARKMKCTCSSTAIQIEGRCCCKRGKEIEHAESECNAQLFSLFAVLEKVKGEQQ